MGRENLDEHSIVDLIQRTSFKDFNFSKVDEGVSTNVYKLEKDGDVYYLRILSQGENASTQVLAHQLLLEQGVHVPAVESYEDINLNVRQSYMIVQDIGGSALETQIEEGVAPDSDPVLFAAGQDLAKMQGVPVQGFGKIMQNEPGQTELKAKFKNNPEFILSKFDDIIDELEVAGVIDGELTRTVRDAVASHRELLDCEEAVLAHGDLDLSHIFSEGDEYKGIIDFGDMRGASPFYDLAYFRFRSGTKYLPKLIEGYQSVKSLGDNYDARIQIEGLIIAVKKLFWAFSKRRDTPRFEKAKRMLREYVGTMTL